MNITELRRHLDEIKWDDGLSVFYDNAATGNSEAVFDLFVLNFLDHDCRLDGIDLELLMYCADNNHSLSEHLIASVQPEIDKDNVYHTILSYYKSKAQNGNPLSLWLLGYCYESFGFDYLKSIESENAYGPTCFVNAFECYKRSVDMDFPLGVEHTIFYITCPGSYGICIKNEETLTQIYALKAKVLKLD